MLNPVLLATWIAYCAPTAHPVLAHALVHAGSEGDPWLVTDASGKKLAAASRADAMTALHAAPAGGELYVGLAQVPRSSLHALGVPADAAIDPCTNLRLGYELFTSAYLYATEVEKTPWKTLTIAFSHYRSRQKSLDDSYAIKAIELVKKGAYQSPAPFGSRLYMAVAVEASTSLAQLAALSAIPLHARGHAASRDMAGRIRAIY